MQRVIPQQLTFELKKFGTLVFQKNRVQAKEQVKRVAQVAKEAGYSLDEVKSLVRQALQSKGLPSERTFYRYWPDELKDQKYASLQRKGKTKRVASLPTIIPNLHGHGVILETPQPVDGLDPAKDEEATHIKIINGLRKLLEARETIIEKLETELSELQSSTADTKSEVIRVKIPRRLLENLVEKMIAQREYAIFSINTRDLEAVAFEGII